MVLTQFLIKLTPFTCTAWRSVPSNSKLSCCLTSRVNISIPKNPVFFSDRNVTVIDMATCFDGPRDHVAGRESTRCTGALVLSVVQMSARVTSKINKYLYINTSWHYTTQLLILLPISVILPLLQRKGALILILIPLQIEKCKEQGYRIKGDFFLFPGGTIFRGYPVKILDKNC